MDTLDSLVVQARSGDSAAFGRLTARTWVGLVRFARTLLIDDLEAEDAVQESLLTAWRKLTQLRDPAAFEGWMRRIVYRHCLGRLRRPREVTGVVAEPGWESPLPPNQASGDVTRALATLSPRQRAVLYLGEIEGHDDDSIAELLSCAPATVRVHRLRARRKLHQILEEDST